MYLAMRKQERLLNQYSKLGLRDKYRLARKKLPQLTQADINEPSHVKMVFVTASPVLTNEVKQYYASLRQQLSAHLATIEKAKEEKESGEAAQGKEIINTTAEQKEIETEREKLLKFIEIREQELIQAEQVDQQLSLPDNIARLRPQHFPLFLTVQRLVYMMDSSCYTSFFSRQANGKIIGMESSLGWHSEDKGVFMINQDYKQSEDIKQKIQEFELQVLAGEKEDEMDDLGAGDIHMDMLADLGSALDDNKMMVQQDEKHQNAMYVREGQLDKEYRQSRQMNNWKYDEKAKKHKRVHVDEFPMCQEVTMEMFEEQFMPTMQRFMSKSLSRRLSPTFIWTEIMSVIKGGISDKNQVYQRYLSRRQYVSLYSELLEKKEKSTIYYIFLKYESWKQEIRAFDFLDVVNHVMIQCSGNGYRDQRGGYRHYNYGISQTMFDFLIIDEVQDLYPKTIKLLLSFAKYKVVFAGDTAQTIAKGVSSKISDMRLMLQKYKILETQSINLSVNYRSQNSILQLANNVVKLVETIFPSSIDKMIEEVSEKKGDKPVLIEPCGDDLLCQFFFGKTMKEAVADQKDYTILDDEDQDGAANSSGLAVEGQDDKQGDVRTVTPSFGASQVIIVRDQAVKAELPEFMKTMLCLTVYEAKGLEFDDVILFNFFAMGQIKTNLWKLLLSIREQKAYRKELPDWILDIQPEEEEKFVEEVVHQAIADYRQQKKEKEAEDEAAQEKNQDQPAEENKLEDDIEILDDLSPTEVNEDDPDEVAFVNKVHQEKVLEFRKMKYDAAIAKFESEKNPELAQFFEEYLYTLEGDFEHGAIQRRYQLLCTELKFLYVAITRPKKRLFIYDENAEARKPLEAIWRKLDSVKIVTKEDLQIQHEQRLEAAAAAKANPQSQSGSLTDTKCDTEQWKFQGLRFLKQKNYTQAIKCFQFARAKNLTLRCKAFIAAQAAQERQVAIEIDCKYMKQRARNLTKREKQDRAWILRKQRIAACRLFHKAGLAFERADIPKFAASCYFTARSYSKAAEIFKQLEQWNQVGECLMRIGKDRFCEAASFFEKGDLIMRAIQCYEQMGEWELLLHCLNRSQDKFGESERQSLVNKYVPIALNNIYHSYGMVEKKEQVPMGDKDNVGQKVEKKIQDKYKVADAINEEDDDYGQELDFEQEPDSDDQEEESKVAASSTDIFAAEDMNKEQDSDDENENEEEEGNVMSKGFQLEGIIKANYFGDEEGSDKEEENKSAQGSENAQDDSFEIINSMSEDANSQADSMAQDQEKMENDEKREELAERIKDMSSSFDHLSQYDLDDEFLQSNRSLSIIGSIIAREGRASNSAMSESSDFSIISSNKEKSLISSFLSDIKGQAMQQINFIQAQEDDDTYVQDVLAQKIIYYLSLWSDEMRKQLNELKDQGILHEVSKDAKNETIDETDFIIQMDDVDQDFVNLILDTLEVYEFYHMSLMMCKRYRLSGRQGRYLVLMCSKYSNLNRCRIQFVRLIRNPIMMEQQRACSLLAHEAIHNVLCLIDTNFLKIKPFGERLTDENSLGIQAYMTILNLGYWKKLVYILEKKTSLQLCMKFFDFRNYMLLMKAFMTQEEKLKNKSLLEIWTLKAQVKGFMHEKQKILDMQSRKNKISSLYDEFDSQNDEIVCAVQLNQKDMQFLKSMAAKIGDYIGIFQKNLLRTERQNQIKALIQEIDTQLSDKLKAMKSQSSDQQKFFAAAGVFDLCFNVPKVLYQTRVREQLVAELQSLPTIFNILQQAYDKLEDFQQCSTFDPIIEGLYATLLISPLENEDSNDPEMQNIFQQYADSYMLVSVNSIIIEDVIHIQRLKVDYDLFMRGESFYAKEKYYHYIEATRLRQTADHLNSSDSSKSLDQWRSSDRHLAFVADMDANFIYVPKVWLRHILLVKIANLQATLIHSKGHNLSSDSYFLNEKLITKLRTLNSKDMNSILKQAKNLSTYEQSDFWKKLSIPQKMQFTAKVLLKQQSTLKLLDYIKKAVRRDVNLDDYYWVLGRGIMPQTALRLAPADINKRFQDGLLAFTEVCGKNLNKLGKEKDLQELQLRLMLSFAQFTSHDNYIPFLEMIRKSLKKEKKKGQSFPDDFLVLKTLKSAINCHCMLVNGQWSQAAVSLISFSQVKPEFGKTCLFDASPMSLKTKLLEFAAVIIFILKFKVCYVPDYAMSYLDLGMDYSKLYGQESQADLLRKKSSLLRQKSLERKRSKEESKGDVSIVGSGKTEKRIKEDAYTLMDRERYNNDYYDEVQTYKKEENDDYDEEEEEDEGRMLIEKNVKADTTVEKPDEELLQQLYEQVLEKMVDLIETINADDMSFIYKQEQLRVYNLLMAAVVNDKKKTARACQLIGQGFNRLMAGPHDEAFMELGVPEEWSISGQASTLSASTFSEQQQMFEEADTGLKWQWFTDFEEGEFEFFSATGLYVAKIDISACQTDEAQLKIESRAIANSVQETKNLAIRMAAGRKIARALRKKIDEVKQREIDAHKKMQVSVLAIDKMALRSKERMSIIMSHARVSNTEALLTLGQIDSVKFIQSLQAVFAKVNFLQELMIVKAFSNSLEISKAITFMNELRQLHQSFCERATLFAKDQSDILNSFDLMVEQDQDPIEPLTTELSLSLQQVVTKINLWQISVFEGKSSGFAIKRIIEDNMASQQRLKLKWQQKVQPSSKRQRLEMFKENMEKRFKK